MKIVQTLLIAFSVLMIASCEVDPVIYTPANPIPVIYAVFDDHESTHYILISKTFGAEKDPAISGSIQDSLYWENLEVEVGLKEEYSNEWIIIKPEKVSGMEKDSGYFLHPYSEYYKFDRVIMDTPASTRFPTVYSIDTVSIRVSIPGYEDASCLHKRIDSIRIVSPRYNQQYLLLTPDSPLLFNWDWFGDLPDLDPNIIPHAWNEIDVSFEFIEDLGGEVRSKWVKIQNTLYNESKFEKYRQINITYEEFIREVLLQIENDPKVLSRKLGIIKMHIAGGDTPMKQYMDLYHGHSDYDHLSYSNFENAYGFLATSTQYYKDSMSFDFETRHILYNENRLKKIKLIK